MSTQIKGFITRDDFVTPRNQEVSPLYELSELSYTYSKDKQVVYPTDQPTYALHVFSAINSSTGSEVQVQSVTRTKPLLGLFLSSVTTLQVT